MPNNPYYLFYKGTRYCRYGKIIVGAKFLQDRPELLFEAFQKIKFLPTKVEHDIIEQKLTYYGFSEEFDLVKEGEEAPLYELLISPASLLGKKEISVKVVKRQ